MNDVHLILRIHDDANDIKYDDLITYDDVMVHKDEVLFLSNAIFAD